MKVAHLLDSKNYVASLFLGLNLMSGKYSRAPKGFGLLYRNGASAEKFENEIEQQIPHVLPHVVPELIEKQLEELVQATLLGSPSGARDAAQKAREAAQKPPPIGGAMVFETLEHNDRSEYVNAAGIYIRKNDFSLIKRCCTY